MPRWTVHRNHRNVFTNGTYFLNLNPSRGNQTSKCGSPKNIYHFGGVSHTNEPPEVQRVSDIQNHGMKWECLSLNTHFLRWSFSQTLTWPSWLSLTPCHVLAQPVPTWTSWEAHLSCTSRGNTAEQNLQLPICFYPHRSKLGYTDTKTKLSHPLDPCTASSTFLNDFMALLQSSHHNSCFF